MCILVYTSCQPAFKKKGLELEGWGDGVAGCVARGNLLSVMIV